MSEEIQSKPRPLAPRVFQIDSVEYDSEIFRVLKERLLEISEYLPPGFLSTIKPELELLIQLLLFQNSLAKNNSTFGQQLLGLEYSTKLTRKQKIAFVLLNYVFPYIRNLYDTPGRTSVNSKMGKMVDKVDGFFKIFELVNFLAFLYQGVYSNPVDRLLGLKMSQKIRISRNLCYTFLMRELLWDACMGLLRRFVPVINFQYLRRKVLSVFSSQPKQLLEIKDVQSWTKCSVCGNSPTYPCRISRYCEHIACYYCIKSNILADDGYLCPACGVKNTANEELQYLYKGQTE